jgi:hypothetical protein
VKSISEYYLLVGNLAWLITNFVLCQKSTDLFWEGEEPDAAVAKENPSAAVEESVHPFLRLRPLRKAQRLLRWKLP